MRNRSGIPGRYRPALVISIGLLVLATLTRPLAAEEDRTEEGTAGDKAERLVEEGVASILEALDLLLGAVPQYAAPEVLPNGDIIIRRLHPEEEEDTTEPPAPPGDSTDI